MEIYIAIYLGLFLFGLLLLLVILKLENYLMKRGKVNKKLIDNMNKYDSKNNIKEN